MRPRLVVRLSVALSLAAGFSSSPNEDYLNKSEGFEPTAVTNVFAAMHVGCPRHALQRNRFEGWAGARSVCSRQRILLGHMQVGRALLFLVLFVLEVWLGLVRHGLTRPALA